MATTTTNNAWAIPQSTDLVTNGATAMATLGQAIDTSVGKGLIAWQSYTPTYTNLTVGNGTHASYYRQLGKNVEVRIKFTFGSTSAMGTLPTATLPVTANSNAVGNISGSTFFFDSSAGAGYPGWVSISTSTTCSPQAFGSAGTYANNSGVSNTIPFGVAWANSDQIWLSFTYEAA